MSGPEEIGTYHVENHQVVQGQIIGSGNTIHQYFVSPDAASPGHAAAPSLPERIWNIPYPRNPFFTGHEGILAHLTEALKPGEADVLMHPQIQAISGLG